MEDKAQIVFTEPKIVEFDYKGHTIKVKSYLSRSEQQRMIADYLTEYSSSSMENAEYFLLFSIIETCTNIELFHQEDGQDVASISIDDLFAHWELVEEITGRIRNYRSFYTLLEKIVKSVTDKENSLNNAIQTGYAKLMDLIETLTHTDISDEQMAKVKEMISELEKSPILNEATRIFNVGKPAKKTPAPRKMRKKKDVR